MRLPFNSLHFDSRRDCRSIRLAVFFSRDECKACPWVQVAQVVQVVEEARGTLYESSAWFEFEGVLEGENAFCR